MKLLQQIALGLLSVTLITCKSAELQDSVPVGAGPTKLGPAKIAALTNPALNNAGTSSRLQFIVRRTSRELVAVSWKSLPHEANLGFILQRSEDGIAWKNVYFQPGQGDKKERPYAYTDTTSASAYYRLGELDEGLHMAYSPVWYLVAATPMARLGAHLNPIKRTVQLVGADPTKPVDVFNSSGQLVQVVVGSSFSSRELQPGIYALRQGSRLARLQVR